MEIVVHQIGHEYFLRVIHAEGGSLNHLDSASFQNIEERRQFMGTIFLFFPHS